MRAPTSPFLPILLALASTAQVSAKQACFTGRLGSELSYENNGQSAASFFITGQYWCDPFELKLRFTLDEDDPDLELQEAFYRSDLSATTTLSLGKAIIAYDKSHFFRPLDVIQSGRLNFDIRDSSGTLAGLPLVSLARFRSSGTTRLVLSRDFENDPDGANLGLEQVVLSREGLTGDLDYAVALRYASGARDTFSAGISATRALNDFALIYGSAVLQQDVRRADKMFALALAEDLQRAENTWYPQLALGMVINPPAEPELTLTLEAFHDGTGLTDQEWSSLGRGFGSLPYMRQNYIGLSAQRSFGAVDGFSSAVHSWDDHSTNLRIGGQLSKDRFSVDFGGDWSFGTSDSEFRTSDPSVFLEVRHDL